jgi:hypothetical protein
VRDFALHLSIVAVQSAGGLSTVMPPHVVY